MMINKLYDRLNQILFISAALLVVACLMVDSCSREEWEDHYNNTEERVDMKLWDALREMPEYSEFVSYMEESELDSLFELEQSYTLFIPNNDAMSLLDDSVVSIDKTLTNHISRSVFLTSNVGENRKLQVINGKFVKLESTAKGYTMDGKLIEYSSPLYLDGKYYEIEGIAYPRLNLYEYVDVYSPSIRDFIDDNDSVFLDVNLSVPVSFTESGQTIYDSVFSVVNVFERDYFPVAQESRNKSATFIVFTQEQYNNALNDVANTLGGEYNSYQDIPLAWQSEVLLPDVMAKSIFDNDLDYADLVPTMISATGDTVSIVPSNINPDSKFECSNGLIYTYYDLTIPEELYQGVNHIEGEELIDEIGTNMYAWNDNVSICGEDNYIAEPVSQFNRDASEDLFVSAQFSSNFSGNYCIELTFKNIFPMQYRLKWHANYRPSGTYAIYVNDELVGEFDLYELRKSVLSVASTPENEIRFLPVNGFNSKDWWVDNITEFGDVRVRFEYIDSGVSSNNGFNIDYVELISVTGNN